MADASGAPRRVSMAYILGFSNKPFKDGGPPAPPPPPRNPSAFKKMVTTPGGVIEWAASDGRRGRLTGPGKSRLTSTNLAQLPSAKASVKAASKKDADDVGDMGMFGLFEDAPAAAAGNDTSKNGKTDSSDDWTEDQDKKLMDMKADNKSWKDIAADVGKSEAKCKEHFNKIKPSDWLPNKAKGGGGKQKQKERKDQKDEKKDDKKPEKKAEKSTEVAKADNAESTRPSSGDGGWPNTDGAADGAQNGDGDGGWGADGFNLAGDDNKDSNSASNDNAGDGAFDGSAPGWGDGGDNSGWNNNDNGGAAADSPWDNKDSKDNSGSNVAQGWDNMNNNSKDNSGGNTAQGWDNINNNNSWDTATPAPPPSNKPSKPSSRKVASQTGSKKPASHSGSKHRSNDPEKPPPLPPAEYELKPDSTFSADDLRLIAKILQQDCHMVWNRVSWRFRDKTGRDLHADVFEKKVTGVVEGKGSAFGGR